ncbi:MAG: restriction endonuclease subunit S, partial [Armatimonadetes bacterium]|nr:restriction endonuclease subunit S [Armatimonadota bacterium]
MDQRAWASRPVGRCFEILASAGKPKVMARDYRSGGRFPVVDQGQGRIAGWTDDQSAVIESPLPVIVFGDHTRALKFVDFPFARGADGTQVLLPCEDIDPLFLYYACRSLDLPSRGYNRHLALLREREIAVPPGRDEQRAIGRVLRAAEAAFERQALLVNAGQRLKRPVMRQLFTRGLRGELQKETESGPVPESWVHMAVGAMGRVVTGTTPRTKEPGFYRGGLIPFISPGDFEHGTEITSTLKLITERGARVSRPVVAGSTCVVCIGSSIGKVGITTAPTSTTNQQINAIEAGDGFEPRYVFHFLTSLADHIRA